jgi:hypothetical protein
MFGTLWLLTQGESRKTKRVRLFTEFVSRRLAAYVPLLAGLSLLATDERQVTDYACRNPGRLPSPDRSKRRWWANGLRTPFKREVLIALARRAPVMA